MPPPPLPRGIGGRHHDPAVVTGDLRRQDDLRAGAGDVAQDAYRLIEERPHP
ncbi:hypothetical protein [Planotetraspora sp. GP83]|uniref:hypothetical protein n=1 Tax=Planotetraspora sp. GP83 TaxID=3156264 RepID=UPI0035168583